MTHPTHPETRIGHVHLKVANLERALAFYHGVLGFDVTQRYKDQVAFLSVGGYHHHIALNTWESLGGSPPRLQAARAFITPPFYTPRAKPWRTRFCALMPPISP